MLTCVNHSANSRVLPPNSEITNHICEASIDGNDGVLSDNGTTEDEQTAEYDEV